MKIFIVFNFLLTTLLSFASSNLDQNKSLNCLSQVLYKMRGGQASVEKIIAQLEAYRTHRNADVLYQSCKNLQKNPTEEYDVTTIINKLLSSSIINPKTAQFVIASLSPFSLCSNFTLNGHFFMVGTSAQGETCRSSNGQVWAALINGGNFSLPPFVATLDLQYRFQIFKGADYKHSTIVSARFNEGMTGKIHNIVGALFLGISNRGGGSSQVTTRYSENSENVYDFSSAVLNPNMYTFSYKHTMATNGKGLAVGFGYALDYIIIDVVVRNIIDNPQITKYMNNFPSDIFELGLAKALSNHWNKNILNQF